MNKVKNAIEGKLIGLTLKKPSNILTREKKASDELVIKVGFIAIALLIFAAWKTGVMNLVSEWIATMSTQSKSFWVSA